MFHVEQSKVIVIGGGHAGCEAALASARMGVPTLLITMDPSKIAEMSCNPSIGGVGKGQLVKELDALGGEMGRNADFTGIQFKRLNTRKGGAVQSSRCQSDKRLYAQRMQAAIAETPNLQVVLGEVKALRVRSGRVVGVQVLCPDGLTEIQTENIIITAGTFMRGLMHCGDVKTAGGRAGEGFSNGLSDYLKELGFELLRLKTGTPPRLLAESIDFSQMERQDGDKPPRRFSFWKTEIPLRQVPCFLTYTHKGTHDVIRKNLHRSPLYSGMIKGVGPRYCPSIEDKVVKFPDKDRHPLFFEPEALDSNWIYPNGVSTSLPADVQEAFIRTLPGCADVKFARHGYAVEYDCIDPRQLKHSLESKRVEGLFFAGQVNGTSGYEEAAAQGLMAGINAALRTKGKAPLILDRSEAYIGVMIDDLVSLGVNEPYRMFTSRAEFRLSLREDNADLRLSEYGHRIGLLNDTDYEMFLERKTTIEKTKKRLSQKLIKPSTEIDHKLRLLESPPLVTAQSAMQILRRPELTLRETVSLSSELSDITLDPQTEETIEVEIKYEGYINMQRQEIDRLAKMQGMKIPETLEYETVEGLSKEIREKLKKNRPQTLADASRVSGVTPAAMTAILFHLRQKAVSDVGPTF